MSATSFAGRCVERLALSLVFLLLLSGAASRVLAGDVAHPPGYRLTWSDDFKGDTLDLKKWTYRTGPRLLSYQTPDNVRVGDGYLRLILKKEEMKGKHYTVGGIISRQNFEYGYYECRFRVPHGAGWHTSFWTTAHEGGAMERDSSEKHAATPHAQEIDICEQDSVNPRSYSAGVIDWSGRSGKRTVGFGRVYYKGDSVPDFAADFHVWGCEFTPKAVRFYLDGKLTHSTDATKFPHTPQAIWLTSVAVLWGNPHPPQHMDDDALPTEALFDWVRYYEPIAKP